MRVFWVSRDAGGSSKWDLGDPGDCNFESLILKLNKKL